MKSELIKLAIKNARKEANISQHELGRRTGISNRNICLWEQGGGRIGVLDFIVIAHALDTTASALIAKVEAQEDANQAH